MAKIKRRCKQCGKSFETIPSQIKNGKGLFCSYECAHESFRTQKKQTCKQCGKVFFVHLCRIKKGGGVFCSMVCCGKWQSENLRGEHSPAWRGGISFEPYCQKFNFAFKEYIRDKFGRMCFLCNKTEEENGKRLSVHHVNYNKNCGCDGDLTCQFVPLCISCNTQINSDRKMWETKIKAKMQNKLNGWYV